MGRCRCRNRHIDRPGDLPPCAACHRHHVPGSPCIEDREPGSFESDTHGIRAVRRWAELRAEYVDPRPARPSATSPFEIARAALIGQRWKTEEAVTLVDLVKIGAAGAASTGPKRG